MPYIIKARSPVDIFGRVQIARWIYTDPKKKLYSVLVLYFLMNELTYLQKSSTILKIIHFQTQWCDLSSRTYLNKLYSTQNARQGSEVILAPWQSSKPIRIRIDFGIYWNVFPLMVNNHMVNLRRQLPDIAITPSFILPSSSFDTSSRHCLPHFNFVYNFLLFQRTTLIFGTHVHFDKPYPDIKQYCTIWPWPCF